MTANSETDWRRIRARPLPDRLLSKRARQRRYKEIDVRHMGQAGDRDQELPAKIQIPWHEAENVLRQRRENASQANRGTHSRTRLPRRKGRSGSRMSGSRYFRPGTSSTHGIRKASRAPSGHGDQRHAAGDCDGRPKRLPEIRIGKDERNRQAVQTSPKGRRTALSKSSDRPQVKAAPPPRRVW